ncbi:MAG: DUF835 domain-containing protein [Methanobacteriota archaeon]
MDGKRIVKGLLALAIASVFIVNLAPAGSAQADQSYVKVSTDYQLLGAQDLHGGGHLTYTLEGVAAQDLRQKVLDVYDGAVSPFVHNGQIESSELKYSEAAGTYIADIERALERVSFFAGSTVSFDPLHEGQGEPITVDAEGFVGESVADSTAPINIYLYFDAQQMSGARPTVSLVARELFEALYSSLSSPWTGKYIYTHMDYRVGLPSFSNTRVTVGDIYVFRTPAGVITKYDVTFTGANYPTDRAAYSSFDFIENAQVSFIVMFVCAYFTSAMPSRAWANYKLSHPRRYRHKAKKIKWIHILSKVLIIFMLIFYFVPNLFMVFGASLYLSGAVIWIFGIVCTVAMFVLAKKFYDKALSTIPEEPIVAPRPMAPAPQPMAAQPVQVVVQQQPQQAAPSGPPCGMCRQAIDNHDDMTKCTCGKVYHKHCIVNVKACPFCSTPFPGMVKTKDVQCPTCAEMNKIPEEASLMSTKCKACGTLLAKIEPGYNYLVISKDRATVYNVMVNMLKSNKMVGLCITSTFPEKIKKEYDLKNAEVVWVSDTTGDPTILNPKRLEFETMRTIGNFLKGRPNAILMLDGFEYLIVENGFEKVLKFIKKINDLSSVNHSTFLVPMGGDSITPEQMGILRKEFDKVIEGL